MDGGLVGSLARRLRAGEQVLSAWTGLGDPALPEVLVREGFHTAVLDMQHGSFTVDSAIRAIGLVALAGAPAVVRVPVGDFATVSRMFDAGAAAVISPMINSVADARAFAAFAKYPPVGERSWGPHRALSLSGLAPADYFARANGVHLALPMIETRAALEALDAILAEPGVDGVFVGPSDLSIALTGRMDPPRSEITAALDHVVARAKAAGKFAGLFCRNGAEAKTEFARGFALCSVSTDLALLRQAARLEIDAAIC